MRSEISLTFTTPTTFSSLQVAIPSDDKNPRTKHWRLVAASGSSARIIELSTTRDLQKVLIRNRKVDSWTLNDLKLYPIATYIGEEEDFEHVLRHHPMRGGEYSVAFNNCQHFAATFLVLLETYANASVVRWFTPKSRYRSVVDSVMTSDNTFLWNEPNLCLEMTNRCLAPTLLGASGFAAIAAESTISVAVPATGILGWLGAPPTLVTVAAPWAAAASSVASFCAFGGVGAVGLSAAYLFKCRQWKEKTKFNHPSISGFPSGYKPPLSSSEKVPVQYKLGGTSLHQW